MTDIFFLIEYGLRHSQILINDGDKSSLTCSQRLIHVPEKPVLQICRSETYAKYSKTLNPRHSDSVRNYSAQCHQRGISGYHYMRFNVYQAAVTNSMLRRMTTEGLLHVSERLRRAYQVSVCPETFSMRIKHCILKLQVLGFRRSAGSCQQTTHAERSRLLFSRQT